MNTPLTIADITIRTDADGRFCLNDLHRAAGEEQRHRPKYWLENRQTLELIAEIQIGGIPPIEAKQGLGTYVVKELVYAYAMWISPAFHLKVIRAYDTMMMAPALAVPRTLSEALRLAADLEDQKIAAEAKAIALESKVATDAPKVQVFDCLIKSEGDLTLTEAAGALKIQLKQFTALLRAKGWIYKPNPNADWHAYATPQRTGTLIEHAVTYYDGKSDAYKTKIQTRVTPKGLATLAYLIKKWTAQPDPLAHGH